MSGIDGKFGIDGKLGMVILGNPGIFRKDNPD
jgi:hypothetical protein